MSSDDLNRSTNISKQKPVVIFRDINESYLVGTDVTCKYSVPSNLEVNSNGWIGLFRVGWRSISDYIYFDWALLPSDYVAGMAFDAKIIFPANKLPTEDGEFYQFCYVISSKGEVKGASTPFQFKVSDFSTFDLVDLVEVENENEELLVVRTKRTLLEDKLKAADTAKQQFKKELELAENEKATLKSDHRKMLNYLVTLNQEGETKDAILQDNVYLIGELKTQNSELNERLTSIQDKIDILNQEKSSMEKRLDDSDIYIVSLQEKIKNLVTDKEMLHGKVKNLEEERELYKSYLEECEGLKARLSNEEMKNLQMRKELERLEVEVEMQRIKIQRQLKMQLNDKENIESLTERLHNAEDKLSAAEVCKSMLNDEVIAIKNSYEEKFEEIKMDQNSSMIVLQENETRNGVIIATLQKEISDLTAKISELQQKYDSNLTELLTLKSNNAEGSKQLDDGGSLFALETAYNSLLNRYGNTTKKAEQLQAMNEQIKESLMELENFKEEQVKEIEELRSRLLMGQEAYQDKYVECERVRVQLSRRSSTKSSDETIQSNEIMSSENMKLKLNLQKSESDLRMQKDDNEKLKANVKELNNEIQRLLSIIVERVKISNSSVIEEMSKSHTQDFAKSTIVEKNILDESFEDASDIPIYQSENVEGEVQSLSSYAPFQTNNFIDFSEKDVVPKYEQVVVSKDTEDSKSGSFSLEQLIVNNSCPVCSFPFLIDMPQIDMENHMSTHGDNTKMCPVCSKVMLGDNEEYIDHVQQHFSM